VSETPPMLREGSGEPLVLLHGIIGSEAVWRHVVPLLTGDYDVVAPNALGHLGGQVPSRRPATLWDLVDEAERQLDELGFDKAHVAGNSMGGWMALELARRGRAESVCALSPGGFWGAEWADKERTFELLRGAVRDTQRGRRTLPLLARSRRFRRWASRNAAVRAEWVSREDLIAMADATLGCEVVHELLETDDQMAPIDPLPCPTTIAWAENDVLFPLELYAPRVPELVPGAEYKVLEDVGHIPMLDDPELVAETIRAATRRASSAFASPSSRGS
jgi:pimeloyl-ACP methyl ester carboxylesterase